MEENGEEEAEEVSKGRVEKKNTQEVEEEEGRRTS